MLYNGKKGGFHMVIELMHDPIFLAGNRTLPQRMQLYGKSDYAGWNGAPAGGGNGGIQILENNSQEDLYTCVETVILLKMEYKRCYIKTGMLI